MRVVVTGAYGLIGSAVLARLHRDGHELSLSAASIDQARQRFPYAQWIEADFARLHDCRCLASSARRHRCVVNCVGVLQDSSRDDVHRRAGEGTCALFDACAGLGVRRDHPRFGHRRVGRRAKRILPHQGAGRCASGEPRSGLGDLAAGLVLGPAAYGGTAMLRGLAGLPWLVSVARKPGPDRQHRRYCRHRGLLPWRSRSGKSHLGTRASADTTISATSLRRCGPGMAFRRVPVCRFPPPDAPSSRGLRISPVGSVGAVRRGRRRWRSSPSELSAIRQRGHVQPALRRGASMRSWPNGRQACRTAGSRGSIGSSRSQSSDLPRSGSRPA